MSNTPQFKLLIMINDLIESNMVQEKVHVGPFTNSIKSLLFVIQHGWKQFPFDIFQVTFEL